MECGVTLPYPVLFCFSDMIALSEENVSQIVLKWLTEKAVIGRKTQNWTLNIY